MIHFGHHTSLYALEMPLEFLFAAAVVVVDKKCE